MSSIGKDFATIALFDDITPEKQREIKQESILYLPKPALASDIDKVILPVLHNLELLKENKKINGKLAELEHETEIIGAIFEN